MAKTTRSKGVGPSAAAERTPRRRAAARGVAVALFVFADIVAPAASAQDLEITNPLVPQRADPYIYRHSDGFYYFTATVPAYDLVELRRSETIGGLGAAVPTVIWRAHSTGEMASHIWAPEIHDVDGTWYVYFAAGSSSNVWDIRVYVLSNDSANPLEGTWQERGQLMTNGPNPGGSFFALDATTFEHQGIRYLVWAESDPSLDVNTVLYIAPMSNPWTLAAPGVRISAPELAWETQGYAVNEGPAVLQRNGKIFVTYSASATDANYCVGLLSADETSDLLDPNSWRKAPEPVLRSANGVYGPGHNQFTTTPDGSVDLLVFHGRDYERIEGDPLNDPNRATRVQPFTWNGDGTPFFGSPAADGTLTVELEPSVGGAAGAAGSLNGGLGAGESGGPTFPSHASGGALGGGIGGAVGGGNGGALGGRSWGASGSGGSGAVEGGRGGFGDSMGGDSGAAGGAGESGGFGTSGGGMDEGTGTATPGSGGAEAGTGATGAIAVLGGAPTGDAASGGERDFGFGDTGLTGGTAAAPSGGTSRGGATVLPASVGGSDASGGTTGASPLPADDARNSGCACSASAGRLPNGVLALALVGLGAVLRRRSHRRSSDHGAR